MADFSRILPVAEDHPVRVPDFQFPIAKDGLADFPLSYSERALNWSFLRSDHWRLSAGLRPEFQPGDLLPKGAAFLLKLDFNF